MLRKLLTNPILMYNHEVNRERFEYEPYFKAITEDPTYTTNQGVLFSGDCLKILKNIKKNQIDTIFADPPFNLGKKYGSNTNDSIPDSEYLKWCKSWVKECVRILKPGGSIFLYNLPKWNILVGEYLYKLKLQFRHWIAIEISSTFPIKGRLYPCHYSLIYYTKGKPSIFNNIRTPIQLCRHCGKEIKDYGGYRKDMNPKGVNLKDVWTDIPPVRHWKFKSQNRKANALSTKLLERVIEMSTLPGNLVLDPFGGSGTTYAVCEYKGRNWIGMEIDFAEDIIHRLESDKIKPHKNGDYVEYD
jgi:site-specific DNA-methyltransferase (adenine-specific)